MIIGSDMLGEDAKTNCEVIFVPSNTFSRGSRSPKLSNKVSGVIGNRISPFLITQTCGSGDFIVILKDFHENCSKRIKKCVPANVKVWLARRGKPFQITLEFKTCFWRLVWIRGYPKNETGYPYDAWIHFDRIKRAEVAIVWFSSCQNAILEDFQPKIVVLRDFWKSYFQRMVKMFRSTHEIIIK